MAVLGLFASHWGVLVWEFQECSTFESRDVERDRGSPTCAHREEGRGTAGDANMATVPGELQDETPSLDFTWSLHDPLKMVGHYPI